ncbi:enoyl-CoA hydratase/isomerase family protein [Halocynthiibacter namhaensis]|uniref:enoyl-CoA hydratase/isomerase family protein n=1 Tax=Halocynthiibacter namhaensis TaxID=1290553 RepID=UPI0005792640|nr:enoyl-CoA hydratase/isomerase family protein [Halocynthiibacter namhaensis]
MIEVEKNDALWTVKINRPEKANSLTSVMLEDLCEVFETVSNAGVNAVILTGDGKVFSAGADLDEARAGLAVSPLWERLSTAVAHAPCLTIAALNGTLAGGAMGMALACDLRIAVPGAKFFYPVMKLGFLPQPSDPKRLHDLVGPARAKLILMAGQKVTAQDAFAFGLVDKVVAPEDLMSEALLLAQAPIAADPAHVAAIKDMVRPTR